MKKSDFNIWRKHLLAFEGGISDHPLDSGGFTNMGITQSTYNRLADRLGIEEPLDQLTFESQKKFMLFYIQEVGADQIRSGKIAAFFAEEYWMGGGNAIRFYQDKLQLKKTGTFSKEDIKAINEYPAKALFEKLHQWRLERYQRIVAYNPSQAVFLKGWNRRAEAFYKLYVDYNYPLWIGAVGLIVVVLFFVFEGF